MPAGTCRCFRPGGETERLGFLYPMAIFFRLSIPESLALEKIDEKFAGPCDCDGYLSLIGDRHNYTIGWERGKHADDFHAQVRAALGVTSETAPFWLVYERRDDRNDPGVNDIRNAAIRLSRAYEDAIVVTLSLLDRRDAAGDLELVLICFSDEVHRRNFKIRYEGKYVSE